MNLPDIQKILAEREADKLVRDFADLHDPSISITDEMAVGALKRAFMRLIRNRQPTVLQVTEEEAMGFPCYQPHPKNAGKDPRWFLAVGTDVAARGVYVIRSFGLPDDMDEKKRTAAAHAIVLAELKQHASYGGFPEGGAT